ncbi:beta-mannosidase [Clostridium akagii]|uniref:beta-mannosidase n=1 Tax=Clostridium akagii TaxID=91623 RepID=UPI00047E39AF|nr:glycoside hydrolase family 2 protein [Clostridium akagii]
MFIFDLNGTWKMKRKDCSEWIVASVPGTVFSELIKNGEMEEPFYRDNEEKTLEKANYNYEYERTFDVTEEILKSDEMILYCDGIDTISEIYINGKLISKTNNMHRQYKFSVKQVLKLGKNVINIILFSPTKYIEKSFEKNHIWGANAMEGFPNLRKSHHMFGWDWGPRIPDMGIWRNIYIKCYNLGKLEEVYVTQEHFHNEVNIYVKINHENFYHENFNINVKINSPRGEVIEKNVIAESKENIISFNIKNPELWWPNGYGNHPLYNVSVTLMKGKEIIDKKEMNIGIRTLTVKKEKDKWGESFEFNINGASIFAMGADYIPEDNILSRCTKEKTEKLIKSSVMVNMNCIRVWGGGYYPEDYFYDLCDQHGLIVWQDFMFACADYELSEEFEENITAELEDNIKRIRNHASLGIWCGNNENESAIKHWGINKRKTTEEEYIRQYEVLFPKILKKNDPNTFYWPSSPSKLGSFKELDNDNMGDAHYWEVWHELKTFTEYRKYFFRFVSEFGFESFPEIKTVESFTLPKDRNPFSYVMENHQKHEGGNGKIIYYISEFLKYPSGLENMLYASQITQAEAIRYGVEHWRRNRGRCMGAIYWQLNDCWPVASWSSIDYYGRWKALHYYAKNFFAPILLSAFDEGTKVDLYVTNETLKPFNGKIIWKLRDNYSKIINQGTKEVYSEPLSSSICEQLDFKKQIYTKKNQREIYLEYILESEGEIIKLGTILFCKPKHFEFLNPKLQIQVTEGQDDFLIKIKAENFTKYIDLELTDYDCIFDDNFFDMDGNSQKILKTNKQTLSKKLNLEQFTKQLRIRSIYDLE